MSAPIKSLLAQNGNQIRLLEAHDSVSRELVRNGQGINGDMFHGIWMSGLTQTTYLGVPDTELISPLERASAMADRNFIEPTNSRCIGAAFDADSGGDKSDIDGLVQTLARQGVSMIIIEDKAVSKPGDKVNSLKASSEAQPQMDPLLFAKEIQAFRKASEGLDMLITARIESFIVRHPEKTEAEEKISVEAALHDALHRASIYCDAGVDAIMIHSKIRSPAEVLQFIQEFRASDPITPLVVVPTTYGATTEDVLYAAGANVIIYANHLMRAKIQAVAEFTKRFMKDRSHLPTDDEDFKACIKTQNYGYLLQLLMCRGPLSAVAKWYRILAETYAMEHMALVVEQLLDGKTAGAADKEIIPVKKLLEINAHQLSPLEPLRGGEAFAH